MSDKVDTSKTEIAAQARLNDARLSGELNALSHALYGQFVAIETMFDGDLSAVGMTLDSALNKFLHEVREVGGPEGADAYARILIKSMSKFLLKA